MPQPQGNGDTTMYIVLAVLGVLLLVLIVQIVYIRMSLSRFSKEDYYKQLMVKNEYTTTHNTCSNIAIFALQINGNLIRNLNTPDAKLQAFPLLQFPEIVYTVGTGTGGFVSVEYTTKNKNDIVLLPISTKLASTSRILNAVASSEIDYITWQGYLFRVHYDPSFVATLIDKLSTKQSFGAITSMLSNAYDILVLISPPSISDLQAQSYVISEANASIAPVVQGFLGSTNNKLDLESIPSSFHVIAYKV